MGVESSISNSSSTHNTVAVLYRLKKTVHNQDKKKSTQICVGCVFWAPCFFQNILPILISKGTTLHTGFRIVILK